MLFSTNINASNTTIYSRMKQGKFEERGAYFINENYRWLSGYSNHKESSDKLFSLAHLIQHK